MLTGYTLQKYTLDKYTLDKYTLEKYAKKLTGIGDRDAYSSQNANGLSADCILLYIL